MSFLFLALFLSYSANATVGRHTQLALASRDINAQETLSEENLISEEGYQQFRGCVCTRSFARGSVIRPEHIVCIGPNT